MATRQATSTAVAAVPAIIWTHADEVVAAEDLAAVAAGDPLRKALAAVLASVTLRWRRDFGRDTATQSGPRFAALMRYLANGLGRVTPGSAADTLLGSVSRAHVLGQRQARAELGLPDMDLTAPRPSMATHQAVADAVDHARSRVRTAEALTRTYRRGTLDTARTVVTLAGRGGNDLDAAARTLVNEGVRDGVTVVATKVGARLLWIAERDACAAACLPLSGHLSDEDGFFDPKLTFTGKPLAWVPTGGLRGPVRHPNCRCRVAPFLDPEQQDLRDRIPRQRGSALTDPTFPEALRREAERSVLLGLALPSEPPSARAKAAQHLLDRITDGLAPSGWQVPKSVRRDAEKDLAARKFRTRPFPS